VERVFGKLREVRARGVTVLLVEQNVKAALALADRATVMVEGKDRVIAPSSELLNNERVAELYLGSQVGRR
jgi:branched-chain amino acid transport system ATP-binding protein